MITDKVARVVGRCRIGREIAQLSLFCLCACLAIKRELVPVFKYYKKCSGIDKTEMRIAALYNTCMFSELKNLAL